MAAHKRTRPKTNKHARKDTKHQDNVRRSAGDKTKRHDG